jgi:hypothetical protein
MKAEGCEPLHPSLSFEIDPKILHVELACAMQNSIPFADMQNAAGNFITPSVESASAAAEGFPMPDNRTAFITNTSERIEGRDGQEVHAVRYHDGPER